MEVSYRYCPGEEPPITEVRMDAAESFTSSEECALVLCPDGDTFVLVLDDEHGDLPGVRLGPEDLDQLIAELQRAKAGCFDGQWPRGSEGDWRDRDEPLRDGELEQLLAEEERIEIAYQERRHSREIVLDGLNTFAEQVETAFKKLTDHLGSRM